MPVKSAGRAVEVLEHFAAMRRPLALKHIAKALGYPQSSASVLLKTLTTLGHLNYNRQRRVYFPTLRVAALGDWVAGELLGHHNLGETIRGVRDATGEQTAIAVQNDIYLQFIRLLPPAGSGRFHIDEGAMILLTQSAVGWTLLSALKDRQVDDIARRAKIAAAGRTVPLPRRPSPR
jgi:DNA-binding IclR family transcriptional regulator